MRHAPQLGGAARGELLAHSKDPADRMKAQQALQQWQVDADLAGIRGRHVAKLPAGEREACRQLWADVAALLKKGDSK